MSDKNISNLIDVILCCVIQDEFVTNVTEKFKSRKFKIKDMVV